MPNKTIHGRTIPILPCPCPCDAPAVWHGPMWCPCQRPAGPHASFSRSMLAQRHNHVQLLQICHDLGVCGRCCRRIPLLPLHKPRPLRCCLAGATALRST